MDGELPFVFLRIRGSRVRDRDFAPGHAHSRLTRCSRLFRRRARLPQCAARRESNSDAPATVATTVWPGAAWAPTVGASVGAVSLSSSVWIDDCRSYHDESGET